MKPVKEYMLDFIPTDMIYGQLGLFLYNKKQILEYQNDRFEVVYDIQQQGNINQLFIQHNKIYANVSNESLAELEKIRENNKFTTGQIIRQQNVVSCYKLENNLFILCSTESPGYYNLYLQQNLVVEKIKISEDNPKIAQVTLNSVTLLNHSIYSIVIQTNKELILINASCNQDNQFQSHEIIVKQFKENILDIQIEQIQFNTNNQNDIKNLQAMDSQIFYQVEELQQLIRLLNCPKSEIAQATVNIILQSQISQITLTSADTDIIDDNMSLQQILQVLNKQVDNDKYFKNKHQGMIEGQGQQYIESLYAQEQDNLSPIVINAYLFNNSIYPIFKKAIKLLELQITQQQQTSIIYSTRNIPQQCLQLINQAKQILHNSLINKQSGLTMQYNNGVNVCKMLISVIQNAGEILQILSNNQETLQQESLQYILQSRIFICVTKILVVMQKQQLNFNIDFQNQLTQTMTFQNSESDINPLYTQAMGYFGDSDSDQLKITQLEDSQYLQSYQSSIKSTKNSAIYQLYQTLLQIDFIPYRTSNDEMLNFIDLLLAFIQQNTYCMTTSNLEIQNKKQEFVFDILRIIFLYNQLQSDKNSDQIYQTAQSLSYDVEEARKFYFISQLMYKIDCGECDKKQRQTTEQFFQQNYFDKDAQLLMLEFIGQKILDEDYIQFSSMAQQQQFDQILSMLQDSIDTIKFTTDFIVRLTHLAAIKGKYDIALGLAQYCFCTQKEFSDLEEEMQYQQSRENQYPYHPCLSAYENTIRILLLKAYKTNDTQAALQAVNCINSFMSLKSPSHIINRRLAILQNQMLFGETEMFQQINVYNANSNEIQQMIQLLLLHKQPTQEQKKLAILYWIQNQNENEKTNFIMAYLYQFDELLALKFIQYLENNQQLYQLTDSQQVVKAELKDKIFQHYLFLKLSQLDDDLENQLRFQWLEKDQNIRTLNPLQMSLCHSVVKEDNEQTELIQQAMKALNLSQLDEVQNDQALYKEIVQSVVGIQQPQQQITQQVFIQQPQIQQQLIQQQRPIFRETRAQILRKQFNKQRMLEIKKKEEQEALQNNIQFRQPQQQRIPQYNQNNKFVTYNNYTTQQQQQPKLNFNPTTQPSMNVYNNYQTTQQQPLQSLNTNNPFKQQNTTFMNNQVQTTTIQTYQNNNVQNPFQKPQQQYGVQPISNIQTTRQPMKQKFEFTTGNQPTNKFQQAKIENVTNNQFSNDIQSAYTQNQAVQFKPMQQLQFQNKFSAQPVSQPQFTSTAINMQQQVQKPAVSFQVGQNQQFNQPQTNIQGTPIAPKRGGLRTNLQMSPQIQQNQQPKKGVAFIV